MVEIYANGCFHVFSAQTSENELLIIAVPVYMGRVPALLMEWLQTIRAQKTPVVCVVVYGNRVYDDALLELKNIMTKCGCKPIAFAAFIGEHSFPSPERPVAEGRPDAQDLQHAEMFGRKIYEKLQSVLSVDQISEVNVPGTHPYRGDSKLWTVDFIAVSEECTQCGVCAEGLTVANRQAVLVYSINVGYIKDFNDIPKLSERRMNTWQIKGLFSSQGPLQELDWQQPKHWSKNNIEFLRERGNLQTWSA